MAQCTADWAEDRKLGGGGGGYGKVYKAADRSVSPAIEFAATRLVCQNEEERKMLNKMTDVEIKKLTAFTHPNIIRLLGYCRTEDMMVLLHEYEQLGTVHKHLLRDDLAGKLSWQDRARIVKGLLSAIKHLHTYDPAGPCYHRDVKPGNLVLTESGDAKLFDCGLAQMVGGPWLTGDGALGPPGTPGFMCPKYQRTGVFNEKSEVYSIGITILQMLGT